MMSGGLQKTDQVKKLLFRFLRSSPAVPALLFLLSLSYYFFYYDQGIIPNDEGHLLHFAERSYDGEVPGRDYYLETYIFGRYVLLGFLFHLFGGPHILIERAMWVVLRAACVVMAFLVGRRIMPGAYSLTAALLLMIAPGPWHKTPYAFSCLLGLLSLFAYLKRPSLARLALCGLVAGICLQLRQDTGIIVIAVSSMVLFAEKSKETHGGRDRVSMSNWIGKGLKRLGLYFSFLAASLLPAVIYLSSQEALGPVIEQCFVEKIEQHMGLFHFIPRLGRMWENGDHIGVLYFAVPPAVFIGTALLLGARIYRKETAKGFLESSALFLVALFSINQAYNHLLVVRLLQCGPPVYLLLSFLVWRLAGFLHGHAGRSIRVSETWIRVGAPSLLGLAYGLVALEILTSERESNLGVEYRGSITTYDSANIQIRSPRAPVWVDPCKAKLINRIVDFLKKATDPNEPIYVACNDSLLYFLTERRNPTRFGKFIMPGESERREIAVTDEMKKCNVKYIVSNNLLLPASGSNRKSTHPKHPIVKLLEERDLYERIKIDTGYQRAYLILRHLDREDRPKR